MNGAASSFLRFHIFFSSFFCLTSGEERKKVASEDKFNDINFFLFCDVRTREVTGNSLRLFSPVDVHISGPVRCEQTVDRACMQERVHARA